MGELVLCLGDEVVRHAADETVGSGPCLFLGLPDDQVDAQAEANAAPKGGGAPPYAIELFPELLDRLAPAEIDVDVPGRDLDARIRRSPEP